MKKIFCVLMAVLCFSLTACNTQSNVSAISNELGVDVSSGKEISNADTHGGFHGDGLTYTILEFSDDEVLKQIQESNGWNELPMDDTVTALVYGLSDTTEGSTNSIGPFITDDEGAARIPEIQNGYYILIDRHSQKDETGILDRASFNFTLGIYDTDTNQLYFCKFDT